MKIILAPMEGVVDHTMRAMLSQLGGLDRCVTEFIRVTNQRLPNRVFYRYCPELRNNSRTPSGTPVYIQLLGGDAEVMAANAARAAGLGAAGIDLNFGCPAKLVNRNDGGSILLREPGRVFTIVSKVRQGVPASIPVTVKIRLGYNDTSLLMEISQAIFEAGADELAIHARTRSDGYKPPAYWDAIAAVARNSPIPVIANGEIWNVENYFDCIEQSQCSNIMLGRGILACPNLANNIRTAAGIQAESHFTWHDTLDLIIQFCDITEQEYERKYVGNRIKQWLGYLRRHYSEASQLFESVKRLRWPEEILSVLMQFKSRDFERN